MNQDNESSSDNLGPDFFGAGQGMRLTTAIRRNQVIQDLYDDILARFMGLNRTDTRCMDIIDRGGRVTAGQLAAESGLTTGAVTIVIDRLAAAGYAQRERDPNDRRKVWITITPFAAELTSLLFGHFSVLGAFLQKFTPEQIAGIIEFLDIGSTINQQVGALLERHIASGQASAETRLTHAAAFHRDAVSAMQLIARGFDGGAATPPAKK
jgi:DNA-binding MarR family transcriptional regulator